ncbi:hypothetical protein F0562_019078 [Nyssa sinensis]|uniref:SBP-type domain-containing protein n=1 Tax=Nyssa sinensis TaxID=561372 RepID=A0A5J4ZDA3_9ASTE|nr:hypothetical protein F0562_019078 [Nyssa sinensis]
MENGWNLIDNSSGSRGQNGNCSNLAWNIWELGTSRFDWNSPNNPINEDPPATATIVATSSTASTTPTPTPTHPEASTVHAFMFSHQGNNLYDGAGSNYHPDPHLMCLKLGKRHYFEDATTLSDCHHVGGFSITKRGKPFDEAAGGGFAGPSTSERVTVASPATVPRCQVEGCNVALVDAKDYHRRHKVCEMHSKAEKVVVLGAEQRFCQQCSRFHAVSQFDDSKRSCRRRLAGHNERRRKSSHDSVAKNPPQGRALSLLSMKNNSGISSADLSSRCSAALSELIAENRAAILARQLIIDRDSHWRHQTMEDMNGPQTESSNSVLPPQHQMFLEPHGWERFNEAGSHVTLDLMQAPSSAFGFLSVRGKSKEDEEQCSEWWSSFGGAHVV